MRHRTLTAALGFLVAATLIPTGQAQTASTDPTGIWRKAQQGEHPGKIEVFRCGSGKRYLCAKIIWLQNPIYKGRPLIDVRNGNASMRGRPILGLQIIKGMAPSGPNVWKGSIYNPEDGNTYKATLTLVSIRQIVLKGCKAFGLLCGQKVWTRSKLDSTPPQIEASAEPEKPKIQAASAVPEPTPKPVVKPAPVAQAELHPEIPHPSHDTRAGFGFITTSAIPDPAPLFSSEKPSTMFAMTSPVADAPAPTPALVGQAVGDVEAQPETEAAAAVPLPDHKPKVVPKPRPRARAAQKQKAQNDMLPWLR